MIDHCELALRYHQSGRNCAQSVVLAFAELTKLDEAAAVGVAGPLGGGMGGTRQELCGAVTGALLVLGMVFPFADPERVEDRKRLYGLSKTFMNRYEERFGLLHCGDLLKAHVTADAERTPAAVRLGAEKHCDIMVVTAVEILEQMLQEEGVL